MVIASEGDGNRFTVYVDPSFPTAWRKEPYYSHLQQLAEQAAGEVQLLVKINKRAIVLLPGKKEVDLGPVEEDDQVLTMHKRSTGEWDAIKVPAKNVPHHEKGKWIRR